MWYMDKYSFILACQLLYNLLRWSNGNLLPMHLKVKLPFCPLFSTNRLLSFFFEMERIPFQCTLGSLNFRNNLFSYYLFWELPKVPTEEMKWFLLSYRGICSWGRTQLVQFRGLLAAFWMKMSYLLDPGSEEREFDLLPLPLLTQSSQFEREKERSFDNEKNIFSHLFLWVRRH